MRPWCDQAGAGSLGCGTLTEKEGCAWVLGQLRVGSGSAGLHTQLNSQVGPSLWSPSAPQAPGGQSIGNRQGKPCSVAGCFLEKGRGITPSSPDCPAPGGRAALWTALGGPFPVETSEVLSITRERDGQIANTFPVPTPDLVPHGCHLQVASGSRVFLYRVCLEGFRNIRRGFKNPQPCHPRAMLVP